MFLTASQYEAELFDYKQYSDILKRQATFCDKITSGQPRDVQYFRVGYYGCGFPTVVRNKEFVVRVSGAVHQVDFTERMQSQYPAAQQWKKSMAPDATYRAGNDMYIMVTKVTPVPSERPFRFQNREVPPALLAYYEQSEVNQFVYQRPFQRGPKTGNEFENLWIEQCQLTTEDILPGLLSRSLVALYNARESSPIENAINALEEKNRSLCQLVELHKRDPLLNFNPLGMMLNGVIDAAVNGGTKLYLTAFLSEEYLAAHPDHAEFQQRIEQLMVDQTIILEEGLKVHAQCPEVLRPFHEKMDGQYSLLEVKTRQFTKPKRMPFPELPYRTPSSSKLNFPPSTPSGKAPPVPSHRTETGSGPSGLRSDTGSGPGGLRDGTPQSGPAGLHRRPSTYGETPATPEAVPQPPPRVRTLSSKTHPSASPSGPAPSPAAVPVPFSPSEPLPTPQPSVPETPPRRLTQVCTRNPFLTDYNNLSVNRIVPTEM